MILSEFTAIVPCGNHHDTFTSGSSGNISVRLPDGMEAHHRYFSTGIHRDRLEERRDALATIRAEEQRRDALLGEETSDDLAARRDAEGADPHRLEEPGELLGDGIVSPVPAREEQVEANGLAALAV